MIKPLQQLPNFITLGNLFCGAVGIERVISERPEQAFLLMLIAALLDFFDGFLARLLNVSGEMGKQLDSLADLVSFGVLPGLIWYYYSNANGYCTDTLFCSNRYSWLPLVLAAGWRLAKFNIDTRQSTGFLGVPTPITGLAFGSIAFSAYFQTPLWPYYSDFYVMLFAPLLGAFLMVSDFPMLAMKFKKGDALNVWKWIFLGGSGILLLIFKWDSLPLIYIYYILSSVLSNFVTRKK